MNKKIISLLLAFFLVSNAISFVFADAGITAGQILSYNPNPVTGALGDAGIALRSDKAASAVLNPAATLDTYRIVASASYSSLFGIIQYNYLGVQFPTEIGNFGLSFMYAGYGDMDYYYADGSSLKMNSTNDMAFVLNYSLPIKKSIPLEVDYGGVGMNLKVLRSSLGDYTTEAFAVDIGGILTLPAVDNISLAAVYRNLGTKPKFVKTAYDLPEAFAAGLLYREKNFYNLNIILDYNAQMYSGNYFSAGASITPVYFLTFRGGVKLADKSLNSDLRLGMSFDFQSFAFDYSYTPSSELNGTHNFNLSCAVGKFTSQQTAYDYYMQNHFRTAVESYFRKDYITARNQFDEILAVYPEHRPSQKYLQKIIDDLADIDMYNARRVNEYMRKAESALDKGNVTKSAKNYSKVLEIDPENTLAKTGIERVNLYSEEVEIVRERQKNSEEIQYLWARYQNFYAQGELVRAKEALNFILDIDPPNESAKDAMVSVDSQLSKIASDKVAEMYGQGMDLFNQGKFQEAIRYFEAIVIAAPHRRDAQELIAKAESNIKQILEYEEQRKIIEQQDKVRGELSRNFETALKFYERNRLEEAVKYFRRSKDLADKYRFEDYSKNAQTYITKISYDLSETHYRKGFEHFRKNNFEAAAKEYKTALSYNPHNTSAAFELERVAGDVAQKYYEEGMTLYSKGEFEKAREYLKKALYFKPDKTEAKRALEKMQ
ncbi:MAG: tetratricopeptide repeat protein [Endomicrobia bacterium]|nr:tetratricopeptide repeat protein [Endomicrobiia bacterium]MCL2145126.1 tetratricopeptide repeat protein [Endomicrobiia bacterium]